MILYRQFCKVPSELASKWIADLIILKNEGRGMLDIYSTMIICLLPLDTKDFKVIYKSENYRNSITFSTNDGTPFFQFFEKLNEQRIKDKVTRLLNDKFKFAHEMDSIESLMQIAKFKICQPLINVVKAEILCKLHKQRLETVSNDLKTIQATCLHHSGHWIDKANHTHYEWYSSGYGWHYYRCRLCGHELKKG